MLNLITPEIMSIIEYSVWGFIGAGVIAISIFATEKAPRQQD